MALIRRATEADLPAIVEFGRDFYAASHWASIADYDPERTAGTLRSLIERQDTALFISPRGLIGMVLLPLWCGDVLTAQEFIFWAGDGQGAALRRAAEAWADEHGARVVVMGAHEPGDMDRIEKFYRRNGYAPHGRSFRKVTPHGH